MILTGCQLQLGNPYLVELKIVPADDLQLDFGETVTLEVKGADLLGNNFADFEPQWSNDGLGSIDNNNSKSIVFTAKALDELEDGEEYLEGKISVAANGVTTYINVIIGEKPVEDNDEAGE